MLEHARATLETNLAGEVDELRQKHKWDLDQLRQTMQEAEHERLADIGQLQVVALLSLNPTSASVTVLRGGCRRLQPSRLPVGGGKGWKTRAGPAAPDV